MRIRAFLALAVGITASPALADEPAVPIGQDPGGTAVAVVSQGIDYTHPGVSGILARDGEGEIIAWDFVDGDTKPFNADHVQFGNLMAELMAPAGLRLIAIRVNLGEPMWLARAASFAERTPAAAVVLPMANIPAELENLKAVAKHFTKLNFVVVPRSDARDAAKAAVAGLANAGVLADGMCNGFGGAREAVEALGTRLCEPSEEAGTKGFQFLAE